MWDRPDILNPLANVLYALAALMLCYSAAQWVLRLPVFPLRLVEVDGELQHVTREQVALIAQRHLRGNFFTMDLRGARDAFRKLPWARDVSVRRRWPDKLEVRVEEHRELGRWGNLALVNTYGELFNAASGKDLPVFYGASSAVPQLATRYQQYQAVLDKTAMKIASVTLTPRQAWQVITEDGLQIELGRDETVQRLQRFTQVYQSTLPGVRLKYADLRYSNGFAVRKPASDARKSVPSKQQSNAV